MSRQEATCSVPSAAASLGFASRKLMAPTCPQTHNGSLSSMDALKQTGKKPPRADMGSGPEWVETRPYSFHLIRCCTTGQDHGRAEQEGQRPRRSPSVRII